MHSQFDPVMSNPSRAESSQNFPACSRRSFLTGTGLGTVGSVVLDTAMPDLLGARVDATEHNTAGPVPVVITLHVNGLMREVRVEPRATFAEVLRGELALTGTKIGCDRGACSACTVWLDGAPVASCMLLAIDVDGRKVSTIEGLASGDELHPVQAAFIAHDAVQCGYCTPGLVMSCAALLAHLCRCGTYPHVFAAMLDATTRLKGKG